MFFDESGDVFERGQCKSAKLGLPAIAHQEDAAKVGSSKRFDESENPTEEHIEIRARKRLCRYAVQGRKGNI